MAIDTTPIYAAAPTRPGSAFRRLALTEVRLLLREPVALFWGLTFPMALLAVMGLASSGPQADLGGLRLVAVYEPILIAFVTVAFAIQGLPAVVTGLPGTADPAPHGDHPGGPGPRNRGPAGRQPGGCPGGDGRDPRRRPARFRGAAARTAGRFHRYVCAGRRGDARSRDADRGAGAHRPHGRRDRDHAVLPADVLRRAVDTPGHDARQPAAGQRLHAAGRGRPGPAGQHARRLAAPVGAGGAGRVRRGVHRRGGPVLPLGVIAGQVNARAGATASVGARAGAAALQQDHVAPAAVVAAEPLAD